MFLIRSAFWLGLAFVVLQPQDWDLGQRARELGTRALDAGRQVAVEQVRNVDCATMECVGGKAIILASNHENSPSPQASTMQDSPSLTLAPVPRPRPVWMG